MTATEEKARFVSGSIMRHIIVMTMTSSFGLVAVFAVDFANLFYISLLGQQELAAAIGYAGTFMFFNISICIGISIAASALVSRALGAGDREKARRIAGAAATFMFVATVILVMAQLPFTSALLSLMGAEGATLEIARDFLFIVVPTLPMMGLAMALSGILRAVGDARRAMYVTLAGGLATAIVDPILIFGLDLGVTGAALASAVSRFTMMAAGLHGTITVHNIIAPPSLDDLKENFNGLSAIAGPAVATNIATPIGNAYVTASLAGFGDDAVAGWAIIGRILPVAFAAIFALSGAVGPIIGQNLGAKQIDRVKLAITNSLIFLFIYTVLVWLILFLTSDLIAKLFSADGEARAVIIFFCTIVAGSFIFNGALFVANACFNNLGFPLYSTFFNWGKATLGTIPFVYYGAQWAGAEGAIAGQGLGAVAFGIVSIIVCLRVTRRLERHLPPDDQPPVWKGPLNAFSSGKGANA